MASVRMTLILAPPGLGIQRRTACGLLGGSYGRPNILVRPTALRTGGVIGSQAAVSGSTNEHIVFFKSPTKNPNILENWHRQVADNIELSNPEINSSSCLCEWLHFHKTVNIISQKMKQCNWLRLVLFLVIHNSLNWYDSIIQICSWWLSNERGTKGDHN